MESFTVIDWFSIDSKNMDVAVVQNTKERPRDGSDLIGKQVLLDGIEYTCIGLDRYLKATPMISTNETVGIGVKKRES